MRRIFIVLSVLGVLLFSCTMAGVDSGNTGVDTTADEKTLTVKHEFNKDELALNTVDILNDGNARELIINEIKGKHGVALDSLLDKVSSESRSVNNGKYRKLSKQIKIKKENIEGNIYCEVPELWLYEPENNSNSLNSTDILVAFPPDGDEKDWDRVKAYNLNKEVVYLDPQNPPDVEIVVVETQGIESLKMMSNRVNSELSKAGFVSNNNGSSVRNETRSKDYHATLIEKISLKSDKEPWILGAAEIYAITSGFKKRTDSQKYSIEVIPMEYLDYAKQTYYPDQVILFWDNYRFNAANVQLFEKDDNHNYQDLAKAIADAVAAIGGVAGQPEVTAVAKIGSAIISAMPGSWFTNSDDYVDSYYTLFKERNYVDKYGASGNALATFKTVIINEN